MKNLYEILVPTKYGDTKSPISTKHHKEWDKRILKVAGGLTIMSSGKGKWIYKGENFFENIIPVRVFCTEKQILKIVDITIQHYRQLAVMYYLITRDCKIITKKS